MGARFFVGLSVGDKKTWSEEHVRRIVARVRMAQKRLPNSTIGAKLGTFTDEYGSTEIPLPEDSVEVVIMNEYDDDRTRFVRDMRALAERIRIELKQKSVILKVEENGFTFLSTQCMSAGGVAKAKAAAKKRIRRRT